MDTVSRKFPAILIAGDDDAPSPVPNVLLCLIQRGNNRLVCFVAEGGFRFYLDGRDDYAGRTGCRIRAYVLTSKHVSELAAGFLAGRPGRQGFLLEAPAPAQTRIPRSPLIHARAGAEHRATALSGFSFDLKPRSKKLELVLRRLGLVKQKLGLAERRVEFTQREPGPT